MEFHWKNILSFCGLLLLLWLCARFLLPFFLPFLLGTGLALASEPAVCFLTRRGRLPRALASGIGVSATVAGALAIVMLILGLLLRQLRPPEAGCQAYPNCWQRNGPAPKMAADVLG